MRIQVYYSGCDKLEPTYPTIIRDNLDTKEPLLLYVLSFNIDDPQFQ